MAMESARETPEISLIRGGPFYSAQIAARLIHPEQWNLGRRLLFAIAIGWIPLGLLTALFQPTAVISLLRDYKVTARMLIAVPVLLLGQVLMESRFRMIVRQVRKDLLAAADLECMEQILVALIRLRDSVFPELVLLLLVLLHTASIYRERIGLGTTWIVHGLGTTVAPALTPAGWYYVLVSQTIYQFLVALCLWKWLLWTVFLFRLSRLNLKLEVTHPDKHGGVGFVGMSPMGFAPIAFAITAAIGATWRHEILYAGAHLMTFKLPAIALLVLIIIIAIGPLISFVPKLMVLRRKGILEYGSLAHLHSTEFHEKWIRHREGREEEFLSAPEISSLTDMATSYENVENMQPFPLEKGSLIALALAVVIPVLPTVVAEIPLKVVLKSLLEAVR
jgi:hypothetical protein